MVPEIGPIRGKRLIERFHSPDKILGAKEEELLKVEGINRNFARAILAQNKEEELRQQLELIEKYQVKLIPLDASDYPIWLKSIYDPPLVLFVRGEFKEDDEVAIAVVGTRRASCYGVNMTQRLSAQLVQTGFTIVSGGARGIDTASHTTALRLKGRTLCVLGCGVDIAYPAENKRLFDEIIKNGALISEYPLGSMPQRQNFPSRNRIISGLCLGVVVIEAPLRSGALITASCALEQGREVFSLPGEANTFRAKGTHQLLREGAKLVENVDDIIEELAPLLKNRLKRNDQVVSYC